MGDPYDQIDDQNHSTSNPTVKPKAITDEVIEARDGFSTLLDKLDNLGATDAPTEAEFREQITSRNLIPNSELDYWDAGSAVAPNGYTLAGTGAAIVKTGAGQSDTTHLGAGASFSAKITFGSTALKFGRTVIATISNTSLQRVRGRTISAAVLVQTSVANHAKLVIDDGVATTASAYHTGGNTVEVLTVTRTLSASATKIQIFVQLDIAGSSYVGGLQAVFASVAPSDWTFGTWPLGYTQDLPGIMLPEAQVSRGQKTFSRGHPRLEPGASVADQYGYLVGNTFTDVSSTQVTGGVESVLVTRTVPANVFDVVGRTMRIRSTILIPGSGANSKTLRFYWGGNLVGSDHLANASAAGACIITVDIVKSSTDAQRITVQYNNSLGGDNADNDVFTETMTEDDGAAITWEIRGLANSATDIEHYTTYEWIG